MNNSDIFKIYQMLYWKNPEEIQLEGIRLAKGVKDLSLLIMPPAHVSTWETCACILSEKSDEELEPYLDKLLEWLQDLNWAGSYTILERLQKFQGEKLAKPFLNSVSLAKSELDTMWLGFLSDLLDNESLKSSMPKEVLDNFFEMDER